MLQDVMFNIQAAFGHADIQGRRLVRLSDQNHPKNQVDMSGITCLAA